MLGALSQLVGGWHEAFFPTEQTCRGSLSFPAIFLDGGHDTHKALCGRAPDLAAFLGLIVLVLLMHFALESTENLTTVLLGASVVVVSLLERRRADT